MEIFYEHTLPFPKPFPDVKISISNEEIFIRKKSIPIKNITGYAIAEHQLKMGPVKGGTLFTLKIFYGKRKPFYFELNRSQFKDHMTITDGIIKGLWKAIGIHKFRLIVDGIKKGYEVPLNEKESIIITPTGIVCKSKGFLSSKLTLITWENLKSNFLRGALGIGDNRGEGYPFNFPADDTENLLVLMIFFGWRSEKHGDVTDFSKIE